MAACTRRAAPIAARPGAAPSPRALTPRQPAQRQPIPDSRRRVQRTERGTGQRPPHRAAALRRLRRSRAARRRLVRRKPARRRLARGPARRRAMRSAAEHRHLGPGLSRRGAAATRAGHGRRRRAGQSGRHANGCAREVQSARPGRRRCPGCCKARGSEPATANAGHAVCIIRTWRPHGYQPRASHVPAAPAAITTCSRCP